jgi:hypothetical protein
LSICPLYRIKLPVHRLAVELDICGYDNARSEKFRSNCISV